MATSYKNRLVCTVSAVASAGLGAFTVSSASSGYVTFAAADDGKSFDIVAVEGTAWEVRTGCVYTHSGTSLSRGTLESSSTGSAVAFSSAVVLTVTPSAAKFATLELAMQSVIPGGRLTLESGVPVSTTDQTAKTSVYYTPYLHNVVPLWDGTNWVPVQFSETTLALGTVTSALPYDVFAYLSSGSLALEKLAWTNDTTRATAVTLQDGRYCKSGDKTRLLLGTFYTTSTTATEDSKQNRLLWNVYNKSKRAMVAMDATASWTYATATVRQARGQTSNRVTLVCGVSGDTFDGTIRVVCSGNGVAGQVGFGVNSTTSFHADTTGSQSAVAIGSQSYAAADTNLCHSPAVGYTAYNWLELPSAAFTVTWYGSGSGAGYSAGIVASWLC